MFDFTRLQEMQFVLEAGVRLSSADFDIYHAQDGYTFQYYYGLGETKSKTIEDWNQFCQYVEKETIDW
ncbi:MAG: hypothetical protein ACRC0V_10930 [Fusobacteriaceae bacterium]